MGGKVITIYLGYEVIKFAIQLVTIFIIYTVLLKSLKS
jgi:hypothetical protein